ncbi:MAG: SMC-Scp complex subunit ScpB [Desulfitobacteriaceae bacterium]|nr:SMC-Scp complex subunit ScpB [Clostridia bacterium]MDD4345488.1 SMC-Scp complex subunit ScpB [Desulfitobacteriaceae bacterium]MDD4400633.1 SMC-Scp complex subunit ScpB [Desulfitobacteriaceae bacterium]
MLFRGQQTAALEALLFVAKEPLAIERLAEILELSAEDIPGILEDLRERYASFSSGITLIESTEGYKLGTKPKMSHYIELLYKQPVQALSGAALEVLAIIAYKQPITRGEVDFLRGVQSDSALATLVDRKLVREAGRKDGPGRPILYVTTEQFLSRFGLTSLRDLPPLEFETEMEINK